MKAFLIVIICMICFGSCSKTLGPTTVIAEDSIRHYYPMVLGDNLILSYTIKNTGDIPFVMSEIQPSCGCIIEGDKNEHIIHAKSSLKLNFKFYSGKNLGYVRHTIRIFGNVKPRGMVALVFDVNVVPPSENTPDYEEVFKKDVDTKTSLAISLHEKVDGTESEKGYYVDTPAKDSREQEQFFWRN